ncbi:PD-(D/E)XK nuclease family protein [Sungkyunkwania multivorans]|uniref:PD-(D/E)XK nuclease family protein n=1 Tax=Sungkyunkwania multivorans TaxID=1173618 RepID=A0ABW3CZM4_9FLAO
MKTFLSEVIAKALQSYDDISKVTFILPSKRACVFLKDELTKQLDRTTFSPQIMSIEDFVGNLSNLRPCSNTQLLFEFYSSYLRLTPASDQESFDTFSKWAQIILQDFNEIDRYLIPHKTIFSHLSAIQDINHWSLQNDKSKLVANYLKFWRKLSDYYESFSDDLVARGIGYQGLIYREAVENLEYYLQSNEQQHVFVGFNALNTAEQNIIKEMLQQGKAEIYWDVDELFFNDKEHDASLFLRRYRYEWKHFENNPFNWVSTHFSGEKNIQLIGVPKNFSQAKYTGELLTKIHAERPDYSNTAVVLADESLLLPTLNSLPEEVERLNITMGYPLKDTPTASFFEGLFQLNNKKKKDSFYFKDVIAILSHPMSKALFTIEGKDFTIGIIRKIQEQNISYISAERLQNIASEAAETLELIFPKTALQSIDDFISNCLTLIKKLKGNYQKNESKHLLLLEYLYRFYELFNQVRLLNEKYGHIKDLKTLLGVYHELLRYETLDFQGEPLEGLQMMGMLETRVLDFETVIITSVNEGILPSGKSNNSFIPFDVKKHYGLPTFKEKDAIYTYHFYRLLQRAQNIFVLYNIDNDGFNAGEKSRFIMQLAIEQQPAHKTRAYVISPQTETIVSNLKHIDKTDGMMLQIKNLASKGFSPTTLTNYIRNPIDFYYEKLLGISKPEEVEETIAANTLGTVVHDALEILYTPLVGKKLEADELQELFPKIDPLIKELFSKSYGEGNIHFGKNLIIFHVAKRFIENFIYHEIDELKSGNSIKILALESDLHTQIDIPELAFPVAIRGKVDRLDEFNGVIRVIDYKTGKVEKSQLSVEEWEFLMTDYKKYSKSIQVLCYAYMIQRQFNITGQMEAGVISFKNLQNGFLKFTDKNKNSSLITPETFDAFLFELKNLILEICNSDIPFQEKEI